MTRKGTPRMAPSRIYSTLAKRCGLSEKTIKNVLKELYLLIAEELRYNNEFYLPSICTFKTKVMGGKDVKDTHGGYRYIEPYLGIKVKRSDNLLDIVNGRPTSKKSRKRARLDYRTKNDVLVKNTKFNDDETLTDIINSVIDDKG